MTDPRDTWRPTASRTMLQHRARLLARVRTFFDARGVLEVDTPVVINAAVSDVHIHSAEVRLGHSGSASQYFLHTSPEYAMKRLLAAGSGDIYQICHVVRGEERGRLHNPEFTLIEWYRIGCSMHQLMDEVEALVRDLTGAGPDESERITYREAFLKELGLDPFTASLSELQGAAHACGFTPEGEPQRDELLELLMGARIGPRLGGDRLSFVHGYPATQAALARIDPEDPRTARRFELYGRGMELANGFEELAAEPEQRARFEADNQERQRQGGDPVALDERLLAALTAGLPPCAGVALGFDRTLMLATGSARIDDVLAFPIERA